MPVLARTLVARWVGSSIHNHQLLDGCVAQALDDVGGFASLAVLAGILGMVIDQHRQSDGLQVLATELLIITRIRAQTEL